MSAVKLFFALLTISCLSACGGSSDSQQSSDHQSSSLESSISASSSSTPTEEAVGLELIPETPIPTPPNVIPSGNNTYFVSPDGSDQASGDNNNPFRNVLHAISLAEPGDVIVLRGGIYDEEATIQIRNKHGSEEQPYTLIAYPGENPIFDFSNTPENQRHGFRLDSHYWNVVGITVRNARHNGIGVEGNHIRLERCVVHDSGDTGIHVSGLASYNLIMNCDSFKNFNADRDPIGNRADGFAAKGNRLGPGNVFYGNRAYDNSDDGFDFWEAESSVVLYNNWSFNNGNADVFGNPTGFQGNGNGFKLGRSTTHGDHVVYRNLAFDNNMGNAAKGFDQNSNGGSLWIINNTGYNNGRNFAFSGRTAIVNNVSVRGNLDLGNLPNQLTNSWQLDTTVDEDMFQSVDTVLAREPRQADGSLPDIPLLKPIEGSALIEAGTKLDRPFNGSAPDLGAYEYTP